MVLTGCLLNTNTRSHRIKVTEGSPHGWVRQNKKKKRIGMGPVYLRGHYGEGRVLTLGDPFRDWEIGQDRMGGLVAQRTVLCWFAVSSNERDQYKKSWPLHYTFQPEMCICRCMQWLGAEA